MIRGYKCSPEGLALIVRNNKVQIYKGKKGIGDHISDTLGSYYDDRLRLGIISATLWEATMRIDLNHRYILMNCVQRRLMN